MAWEYKNTSKTLIVCFSYTAGNTKRIAEKIQQTIGGGLVCLEPVKSYSKNDNEVVNQGQEEVKRGCKPELKPLGVEVKELNEWINLLRTKL